MGDISSAAYLGIAIVFTLFAIVTAFAAFGQISKMIAKPSENVIQVNIDYRFIPFGFSLFMVFVLGSTAYFGLQKSNEQSFLANDQADERGMMGTAHLLNYLAADDNNNCDHVNKPDGGPVIIAIDTDSEVDVICGVTHDYLTRTTMVPFVKIGGEYHTQIGNWPFEFTLAFTATE